MLLVTMMVVIKKIQLDELLFSAMPVGMYSQALTLTKNTQKELGITTFKNGFGGQTRIHLNVNWEKIENSVS